MKITALALLVIATIASCGQKKSKESINNTTENIETIEVKEKGMIENLLREYEKSLNNSDAQLAQSLYSKDGVFMPPNAASGIGSEAILKS